MTAKLAPANLGRFTDGSIAIDSDKVDNPDGYKDEPLEGGPTDPNPRRADSSRAAGLRRPPR